MVVSDGSAAHVTQTLHFRFKLLHAPQRTAESESWEATGTFSRLVAEGDSSTASIGAIGNP